MGGSTDQRINSLTNLPTKWSVNHRLIKEVNSKLIANIEISKAMHREQK